MMSSTMTEVSILIDVSYRCFVTHLRRMTRMIFRRRRNMLSHNLRTAIVYRSRKTRFYRAIPINHIVNHWLHYLQRRRVCITDIK